MKILVFNGSPRKTGFSKSICENIYLKHENVTIINAYDKNVLACIDCGYCNKHVCKCIYQDMDEIYNHISEADLIIAVSPIHVGSISGPLLNMFSRLQIYYANKFIHKNEFPFKRKVGFGIGIAGSDWGEQELSVKTIFAHAFFEMNSSLNYYYIKDSDSKSIDEINDELSKFYMEVNNYVENLQ